MSKISPSQRVVLTMIARDDEAPRGPLGDPYGWPGATCWRGWNGHRARSVKALRRKGLIRLGIKRMGAGISSGYWTLTEEGVRHVSSSRSPLL